MITADELPLSTDIAPRAKFTAQIKNDAKLLTTLANYATQWSLVCAVTHVELYDFFDMEDSPSYVNQLKEAKTHPAIIQPVIMRAMVSVFQNPVIQFILMLQAGENFKTATDSAKVWATEGRAHVKPEMVERVIAALLYFCEDTYFLTDFTYADVAALREMVKS